MGDYAIGLLQPGNFLGLVNLKTSKTRILSCHSAIIDFTAYQPCTVLSAGSRAYGSVAVVHRAKEQIKWPIRAEFQFPDPVMLRVGLLYQSYCMVQCGG